MVFKFKINTPRGFSIPSFSCIHECFIWTGQTVESINICIWPVVLFRNLTIFSCFQLYRAEIITSNYCNYCYKFRIRVNFKSHFSVKRFPKFSEDYPTILYQWKAGAYSLAIMKIITASLWDGSHSHASERDNFRCQTEWVWENNRKFSPRTAAEWKLIFFDGLALRRFSFKSLFTRVNINCCLKVFFKQFQI